MMLDERFIDRDGPIPAHRPELGNCHVWIGGRTGGGYGRTLGSSETRRLTHRVSWEEANGRFVPDGFSVCHACDNPSCVRQDHSFLGTHAENMADREAKGRHVAAKGEDNGNSRLTEGEVLSIRKLYESGDFTQQELADTFVVTDMTISYIVRRKVWKHI